MQKRFWVILLSAIIFLSGAVLGISAVYRVDKVTVEGSLVSEEAEAEEQVLQEKLEAAYEKTSIFFASEKEAQDILEEFPYFRLIGFEKAYPNRLIVKIIEDAEVYAVETADVGYYILGADGTVLGTRDTHVNTLNGAENVIIKGVRVTGENGKVPVGDEQFPFVLSLCKELSVLFEGIRSNVVSVEVIYRGPEIIYCATMREGVKLYFGSPSEKIQEKAEAGVVKYLSLTNEEKLSGRIVISETNGKIFTSYAEKDDLMG